MPCSLKQQLHGISPSWKWWVKYRIISICFGPVWSARIFKSCSESVLVYVVLIQGLSIIQVCKNHHYFIWGYKFVPTIYIFIQIKCWECGISVYQLPYSRLILCLPNKVIRIARQLGHFTKTVIREKNGFSLVKHKFQQSLSDYVCSR